MNATLILIAVAVLLCAVVPPAFSEDTPKKDTDGANAVVNTPSLRQPGFIFLELETKKIDEFVSFFKDVMDFKVTERKGRFASMQTNLAELLLVDPEMIPAGHPFHNKLTGSGQGLGVEMGFVVADVDKAYAAAVKHEGFKISSGIVLRPWGVRDFRVLSPDGYYFRFTEAKK